MTTYIFSAFDKHGVKFVVFCMAQTEEQADEKVKSMYPDFHSFSLRLYLSAGCMCIAAVHLCNF